MRLVIEGVSKQYRGGVVALRDFHLDLGPGVHGLLGPNGAGKSTLMRILATVSRPTSGRVLWDGADTRVSPNELREVLGYLPQDFGVYPNLTAEEFLAYLAAAKGLDRRLAARRIDGLLQLLNLEAARDRPLGGFSGGMRQRVGIAQALLNDPRLLIVDEPTAGLDPEERVRFRDLLTDLAGDRVVLLSTHIVSDVEATASDLAVIAAGRLLVHATPEVLLRPMQGRVWHFIADAESLPELRERHLVTGTARRPEGVRVRVVAEEPPTAGAEPVTPGLEDAYLDRMAGARAEPQGAEG